VTNATRRRQENNWRDRNTIRLYIRYKTKQLLASSAIGADTGAHVPRLPTIFSVHLGAAQSLTAGFKWLPVEVLCTTIWENGCRCKHCLRVFRNTNTCQALNLHLYGFVFLLAPKLLIARYTENPFKRFPKAGRRIKQKKMSSPSADMLCGRPSSCLASTVTVTVARSAKRGIAIVSRPSVRDVDAPWSYRLG